MANTSVCNLKTFPVRIEGGAIQIEIE